MTFNKRRTQRGGHYYVCREGKRDYRVDDSAGADGRIEHKTFVSFDRVTSNVFGNGSTNVYQSGWRFLPAGPMQRRLTAWFALWKERNELSPA
jgi:hypothetical protein